MLTGAGIGFLFGLGKMLTGIAKNKADSGFQGSYTKAATTLVISTIAGASIEASGMPVLEDGIMVATTGLIAVGIDELVENILKAIKRKIWG